MFIIDGHASIQQRLINGHITSSGLERMRVSCPDDLGKQLHHGIIL